MGRPGEVPPAPRRAASRTPVEILQQLGEPEHEADLQQLAAITDPAQRQYVELVIARRAALRAQAERKEADLQATLESMAEPRVERSPEQVAALQDRLAQLELDQPAVPEYRGRHRLD